MIITAFLDCSLDKANPGGAATTHKRSFFKKSPPRFHELLRSLLLLFSFAISPLPTSLQPVFGDEDDDKIPLLLQSCSLHNPAPAPSGNTRQLRQAMTSGACLLQTRRYITPIQTLSSSLHAAECVTVAIAKFCSRCSPERSVIATENALAALDRRAIPFLLAGADAPAASRSPKLSVSFPSLSSRPANFFQGRRKDGSFTSVCYVTYSSMADGFRALDN